MSVHWSLETGPHDTQWCFSHVDHGKPFLNTHYLLLSLWNIIWKHWSINCRRMVCREYSSQSLSYIWGFYAEADCSSPVGWGLVMCKFIEPGPWQFWRWRTSRFWGRCRGFRWRRKKKELKYVKPNWQEVHNSVFVLFSFLSFWSQWDFY